MQTDPRALLWQLVPRLPKCRTCYEPATRMGPAGAMCEAHGREPGTFHYPVSYAKQLAPIVDFLRAESFALATREGEAIRKVLAELTPELVSEATEHTLSIVEDVYETPEVWRVVEHVQLMLARYTNAHDLNDHRNGLLRKAATLVGIVVFLDLGGVERPREYDDDTLRPESEGGALCRNDSRRWSILCRT